MKSAPSSSRKQVDLDLAQFNLKQDQELNYSVRVTDTKNDSSFSTPSPDAASRAGPARRERPPRQDQIRSRTPRPIKRRKTTERTQGAQSFPAQYRVQPVPTEHSVQASPSEHRSNQTRQSNTASDQSAIRGSTEPPNQSAIRPTRPGQPSAGRSKPVFPAPGRTRIISPWPAPTPIPAPIPPVFRLQPAPAKFHDQTGLGRCPGPVLQRPAHAHCC